ncbi:MAG: hypothetical protein A2Y14_00860 [Verrucomicrobia bacterium GWF2_51_19]|nr:MAG: hypothetical protein A2Y14_00860 [Verrucomicrobia bacterium GWF2_51_19]HAD82583.1 hypothetical protein [Candidatus Edwardsbacteria bacterium]
MAKKKRLVEAVAKQIDKKLMRIREAAEWLALKVTEVYAQKQRSLQTIDKAAFSQDSTGVFLKRLPDGGSALFVSTIFPLTEDIREVAYLTEALNEPFKKVCGEVDGVLQVYYNEKHCLTRIFPFFDVTLQFDPQLKITDFPFYYLADDRHNPQKSAIWMNEPYVDPAGRGIVISVLAPVYIDSELEGVVGIDVCVHDLQAALDRELKDVPFLITTDEGAFISIHKRLEPLLDLYPKPPASDIGYATTPQAFNTSKNLFMSPSRAVRKLFRLFSTTNECAIKIGHDTFDFYKVSIPEIKWFMLVNLSE